MAITPNNAITNFPNGVSSFGIPLFGDGFPTAGRSYFLDPTNGSDGWDGTAPGRAFKTLPVAYAALTAGQNDKLYYLAGTSSISLSAAFEWAKDYTHFIGVTAPSGAANRARIFQTATATGLSPLFKVSAKGCILSNFYIFQGVDDATSLINVEVTGGRNLFDNVHFAGGGHDTMAIDNCASLFLNGAEENRFVNCRAGVTTIALGDGGNVIRMDGSAKENVFENCRIAAMIDNAGARLVELVDTASADQINWFLSTTFISNSANKATTMASAFEIPSGHTTTASLYLDGGCGGFGFTDWDANDRGLIYLQNGTITAGGNAGIAQPAAST